MTIDDLVRGSIDMHCHHTPNESFRVSVRCIGDSKIRPSNGDERFSTKKYLFPYGSPGRTWSANWCRR